MVVCAVGSPGRVTRRERRVLQSTTESRNEETAPRWNGDRRQVGGSERASGKGRWVSRSLCGCGRYQSWELELELRSRRVLRSGHGGPLEAENEGLVRRIGQDLEYKASAKGR